jgi:hypothetical protein
VIFMEGDSDRDLRLSAKILNIVNKFVDN